MNIKLPSPLARLANARHGRYVMAAKVPFQHRGAEWRERIEHNRAVAYRIHLDVRREHWISARTRRGRSMAAGSGSGS